MPDTSAGLFAQWELDEAVQSQVSFDANGGAGEMEAMLYANGSVVVLPFCTFTAPTGCTFDGWNSRADGTVKASSGS